jgi:mannose-6-phosphate isomerase-like protein (cupin superfamily)
MKAIDGYFLITPENLHWRPSSLMKIPNADFLERTGSQNLGARLWRFPPRGANTLHKHIRAEEFYFVLEGVGRMRVGDETLTVPKYGGVLVGPDQLRQVFNDTDSEVLWLVVGAPEETEFLPSAKTKPDMSFIYPVGRSNCLKNWLALSGRRKVDPWPASLLAHCFTASCEFGFAIAS